MYVYVGLAIGGVIFCLGVGLCIRFMSKFHARGASVSGENESQLSETEAESRERNRTELILEQQERNSSVTNLDIPLPSYEDALNQPRNDEVNGSIAEEGLGKVRLGEESPPHYEVAKEREDLN